jgi:poly(3-hydroxybutyrate) depolymerase
MMTYKRGFGLVTLLMVLSISTISFAGGLTIDETIPPGNNFDKAEFRLWLPGDVSSLRAVVILVPGSNGDGRPMADDAGWQEFATKNRLALVGVRLTDKPHEQSFIENYVNVSQGSGQGIIDGSRHICRALQPSGTGICALVIVGNVCGRGI